MEINNDVMIFLAYGIGIFTVFFFGRLLVIPAKLIAKLILNSIAGAGILAAINIISPVTGLSIPLNAINAVFTGILGLPGVIMLILFLD